MNRITEFVLEEEEENFLEDVFSDDAEELENEDLNNENEKEDAEPYSETDEVYEEEYVKSTSERENTIEWYTGHEKATVSFTQRRMCNKVIKFAEKYPNEVEIVRINKDGSILAHIPYSYINIRRPREISEEQREAMRKICLERKENGTLFKKN